MRNPLFSISASIDALGAVIGQDPGFTEHAALLRSQVGRLTQLTRDLLDYGRPQALQPAPASLADVVRRAVRACSALARQRSVTVAERVDPALPRIVIDAARLEQALENLIANAIQHSPPGAAVSVAAGRDTADDEGAIVVQRGGRRPGAARGDRGRVFEPFFTRRKGGTGLGLSIVQRLVEAHGGRRERREPRGRRRALQRSLCPWAGHRLLKEARVAERQILVVDDDDGVRTRAAAVPGRQGLRRARGRRTSPRPTRGAARSAASTRRSWTSRCRTATASTCCAP